MRGDNIRGWFTAAEGRKLYDLAGHVAAGLEVVELGAYAGRSTAYLAEGVAVGKGAHITSIDPWSYAHPGEEIGDALRDFERHVDRRHVTWVQAYSWDIRPYWRKPIGLLFVDASHSYKDTARDIAEWEALVAPEGRMAFHDYGSLAPGVIQATDEAATSGRWAHESLTGGLRVLRRP